MVAMVVGNTWKNQLSLISAGIQMQSFMHMWKKTGDINTCWKDSFIVTWSCQKKNLEYYRIKI